MQLNLQPDESVLLTVNGVPVKIGCEQRDGERWLYVAARTPTYEATVLGMDARLNFREKKQ